jgi:hypothetical protein
VPNLSPNFIDLNVSLPGLGVATQTFNVGLIIGTSTIISGATRTVEYSSLAAMLTAGFSTGSPEYLAAVKYFGASSQPNRVVIGRKDATASETSLVAITACRASNSTWYAAYDTSAADSDQAGIAAYIEALTPSCQYFCQTSTSAVKAGTGGNIFETLKTGAYSRTQGMFSTVAHAMAGVLGYVAGKTSNLAGSYYDLMFKNMVGVAAESLTEAQVTAIEGNYGNVLVNRGAAMYEKGQQFSGQFFDEVLGLDMLANEIQVNATNLFLTSNVVPQTEKGMAQLRTVIGKACKKAVERGFLAEGRTWDGPPVLTLNTGDLLDAGYLILSDPINGQSSADRAARVAPPIYVCINLAGSVHSLVIAINVNR